MVDKKASDFALLATTDKSVDKLLARHSLLTVEALA